MFLQWHNLFSVHKLSYIKNRKSRSDCILCSIAHRDSNAAKLFITEGSYAIVCVNKYPYNPGHLLIFPKRHITDYRQLIQEEETDISCLLKESLDILSGLYSPSGYNIGYNIGEFSGASIHHLHMHVIPRYRNELGFIDIIGGAKIIIEEPVLTTKRLKEAFEARLHDKQ